MSKPSNLIEVIEKLTNSKKDVFTLEELYALKISEKYLDILVYDGFLTLQEDGTYNYKKQRISKKRATRYIDFERAIGYKNYDRAYRDLCANMAYQESHNYDDHLRMFFMLLQELLDDGYDFSMLDDLYYFSEKEYSTDEYQYFIKFKDALYSKDYEMAFRYLELFSESEAFSEEVSSSVRIFKKLLRDVIYKNSNVEEFTPEERNEEFKRYVSYIKCGDYKKAYDTLNTLMLMDGNPINLSNYSLYSILTEGVIFVSEGNILVETKFDCEDASMKKKLIWSIRDKNFLKSFELIRNMSLDTNRMYFIYTLLKQIVSINEENKAKVEELEEEKRRRTVTNARITFDFYMQRKDYENALEQLIIKHKYEDDKYKTKDWYLINLLREYIQVKKGACISESYFEYGDISDIKLVYEALKNKDYYTLYSNIGKVTYNSTDKYLLTVKELIHQIVQMSRKNNAANSFDLKTALLNKQYREVVSTLEKVKDERPLSRFEHMSLKLSKLAISDYLVSSDTKKSRYKSDDHISRFFEAVNNRNYYEALDQAKAASEITHGKEMIWYIGILEDIIANLKTENVFAKQEVQVINHKVNELIGFDRYFDKEKMNSICKLLEEEFYIVDDLGGDIDLVYYLYDLVDMVNLSSSCSIDLDLLPEYEYTSKENRELIMQSLANHDYSKCYEIIKRINFRNNLNGFGYEYLLLVKKLLYIIDKNLHRQYDDAKIISGTLEEPYEITQLKQLVKSGKHQEAFDYFVSHDIKFSNKEDYETVAALISYLSTKKSSKKLALEK